MQVKHFFIKIAAFWGYVLVPNSHTISPRVFVCVSPTCTCVSAICSNTVGPTILIEVSKERFYCPGCVVTHRNCLTWSIGGKKCKRMAFLSKITRSRHTFQPFAAIPVVLECWLRCLLKALGVLHIIYLHSFAVVSILWHVEG